MRDPAPGTRPSRCRPPAPAGSAQCASARTHSSPPPRTPATSTSAWKFLLPGHAPRPGVARKPRPSARHPPFLQAPPLAAARLPRGGGGPECRGAARGWLGELSRVRGSGSGSGAGGRWRRRRVGVGVAAGGSARSSAGAGSGRQRPRLRRNWLRRRFRAAFAAVAPRRWSRRVGL